MGFYGIQKNKRSLLLGRYKKKNFLSSGPDRSMEYKKILEISIFW